MLSTETYIQGKFIDNYDGKNMLVSFNYTLYSQIVMGGTCCTQINYETSCFQVSDIPKINQYFEASLPKNDPFLNQQLQKSDLSHLQSKEPLKHKIYDRWYWGNWKNGQPIGKAIAFIKQGNGKIFYEGEFKGEPHGEGRVIFNEGEYQYEGSIVSSKASGYGKLKNNKLNYEFEGEWKDSKPYKGNLKIRGSKNLIEEMEKKLKSENQQILVQIDEDKTKNKIHYPDGRIYEGQINKINYIPHGMGKVTFPNKSTYDGDWDEGKMHGKGTFKWADGSEYHGDYLFGKKHGAGRFVFCSGNYYEGYWAEGKQNGRGLLYDKDSNELKNGYWRDGLYEGSQKNSQIYSRQGQK